MADMKISDLATSGGLADTDMFELETLTPSSVKVTWGTLKANIFGAAVDAEMAWFILTHNTSQAINHADGVNQKVTLAGNTTFGAPSNGKPGQPLNLWIVQDGTGSRTGTWDAAFDFGDATVPTLTTTAGDGDLVTFMCLTTGKYAYLGIRKSIGA